jgi:multidrug efflux pump subunit AcrA (membrane-fusion protein)
MMRNWRQGCRRSRRIATGSSRVLALPQSALHRENQQTYVVVEKGKDTYERRPVTVGASLDGSIEILAGVTPSDRVVTSGSILLKKTAQ